MITGNVSITMFSMIVALAALGASGCKPSNGSQTAAAPPPAEKKQPAKPTVDPNQKIADAETDSIAPADFDFEFLTGEEIAALNRTETIDRLAKVASARKQWKHDSDVNSKLDDQWKLLMDRLKEVPSK